MKTFVFKPILLPFIALSFFVIPSAGLSEASIDASAQEAKDTAAAIASLEKVTGKLQNDLLDNSI